MNKLKQRKKIKAMLLLKTGLELAAVRTKYMTQNSMMLIPIITYMEMKIRCIAGTPASLFKPDTPVLDKRRVKRYHRTKHVMQRYMINYVEKLEQ